MFMLFSSSSSSLRRTQQSKLADSSDWPTLGSEATTIPSNNIKKEISNATSNGDLRDKEKDKKPATSSKPKSEISDTPPQVVEKQPPKEVNEVAEAVAEEAPAAATTATVIKANSPVPDANATNDKEVKNVPKAIDDGAKRVNAKPKWNRFDVEPKSSSTSSAPSTQNRRKTERSPPRRSNRDDRDYYSRRDDRLRDDDRSNRRGNSNRGTVPSSSTRNPRSAVAPAAPPPASAVAPIKTAAPTRGPRREPAYITRSNRPSYTESKTPGLNGNPIATIKSSDPYDAKKQKPLLGRPIIIDASAIAPIVTAQNIYGTYYFNGPTPFTLDTIGNIKESIKKQM